MAAHQVQEPGSRHELVKSNNRANTILTVDFAYSQLWESQRPPPDGDFSGSCLHCRRFSISVVSQYLSRYLSIPVSLYLCILYPSGRHPAQTTKKNAPEGGKPSAFPFELWVPAALSPPSGGRKSKMRISQNPLRTSALSSQISLCASKKAASARLFFPPARHASLHIAHT